MASRSAEVETIDVLAEFRRQEFRRDPYPFLRRLRENEPVHRTAAGFYLVSLHSDAQRFLQGAGTDFRTPDRAWFDEHRSAASRHPAMSMVLSTVLFLDPPEHRVIGSMVSQALNPRRIKQLRTRIRLICDELLDTIAEPLSNGEIVDFHGSVAQPLTARAFCDLLGVPEGEHDWLVPAVTDLIEGLGSGSEAQLSAADGRAVDLQAYFRDLTAQRRTAPRDDLMSALIHAWDSNPDQLHGEDLQAVFWLLCLAGFELTAAGADYGVRAMHAHPEHRHWLSDGHDKAVAFVDEVLRHDGVAVFTEVPQLSTRDIDFEGGSVPAGSDVRPLFAAANRDPAVFRNPDLFDPARDNTPTLAFSRGLRRCLGSLLARTEIAICLSRVYDRFPTLVPAGEPTWNTALTTRMPTSLPVALERTPPS
jgi:cytochrome P450